MEPSNTNKVLVNVILDRSGSMQSSKHSTISGYNEYIQGLRADKDTEYSVSLTQFDAPMTQPELTVTYLDRALADVPELSEADYNPRGNTPLYDALGEVIRRVDAKGRAVITLIITDGEENSSTEFTKESVTALIKAKEAEGWTFAFLGADIDSYAVAGRIGMAMGNTANYVKGNEHALYSNLVHSTMARSSDIRSMGPRAAAGRSFITDKQRQSMLTPPKNASPSPGGRPAVPGRFQGNRPGNLTQSSVNGPKRPNWTTNSA